MGTVREGGAVATDVPSRHGRWSAVHRTLWTALATATVLAALFLHGLPLLPTGSAAQERVVVVPDPFPNYSHLASPVQGDPVGPVLMVFAYGQGVELMDAPTVVTLGADGTTYRHLRGADSDTRPFLISPDGTAVAVGTTGGGGRLTVIDLLTGDRRRWTVRKGSSVYPAGWSADSRSVFVTTPGEAWSWIYGPKPRGDWGLHRVDTHSPRVSAVVDLPAGPETESAVAALPGGEGLLVGTGGVTERRDAAGVRTLVSDVGLPRSVAAGPVSPDGRHVATEGGGEEGDRVAVFGLGDARVGPAPTVEHAELWATALGWLDERRLLVGATDENSNNHFELWTLDAISGAKKRVLVSDPGWTGASVTSISMAGDLLQGASIQPVDDIDHGYPYVILRSLAWLFLLPLAHQLWRRWRSRDRWRRPAEEGRCAPRASTNEAA